MVASEGCRAAAARQAGVVGTASAFVGWLPGLGILSFFHALLLPCGPCCMAGLEQTPQPQNYPQPGSKYPAASPPFLSESIATVATQLQQHGPCLLVARVGGLLEQQHRKIGMGDDPAHPLGHQEVSDDEDADHLVPPVTPPGLSPDGGEWDFSDRLAAGVVSRTSSQGSGRHPQPTRHASLDAGYLQQRLYAAAHAVLLPGSSGAPHEQGALGVDKGSRGVHSAGGATPNDGIEIAWVSSLLHSSGTWL